MNREFVERPRVVPVLDGLDYFYVPGRLRPQIDNRGRPRPCAANHCTAPMGAVTGDIDCVAAWVFVDIRTRIHHDLMELVCLSHVYREPIGGALTAPCRPSGLEVSIDG